MPQISDLFNFANFSDRKQFVIAAAGIVLYFGYRDYKLGESNEKVVTQWKELYNTKSEECSDIRTRYDNRIEKDIQKAENEKVFKDSINFALKSIQAQKESK